MIKLSAYLITLNEEQRLDKTLEAVSKVADEIIVVDSGSTDKTEEIAKKHNAKFMFNQWKSYCDQKSFAEKQCRNDWVLLIDADEVLSDGLIAELLEFKKQTPAFNAYNLKIANVFPNENKPRLFAQSFNVVRLYNRNFAHMPPDKFNKDRIKVDDNCPIGQLKNKIHHYCFLSIEQTTAKYNLHSSELVKTVVGEKRQFSKLRLYTEFFRQFFFYFFMKKYCLLGSRGLVQAIILAHFRFLKIAKWFEQEKWNKK